jgi:hypothetical protein
MKTPFTLFLNHQEPALSKRDVLAAIVLNSLIQSSESVKVNRNLVKVAVAWTDALIEQLDES